MILKKISIAIFFLLIYVNQNVYAQCQINVPSSTPSNRFTVNTISRTITITDKSTGLMWKQCTEGLSGTGCSLGSSISYTWSEALQLVKNTNNNGYLGYNDWRLPNIKELHTIVELGCYSPSANINIFPKTMSDKYWTSSPDEVDGEQAWFVDFGIGVTYTITKNNKGYVRLVRG